MWWKRRNLIWNLIFVFMAILIVSNIGVTVVSADSGSTNRTENIDPICKLVLDPDNPIPGMDVLKVWCFTLYISHSVIMSQIPMPTPTPGPPPTPTPHPNEMLYNDVPAIQVSKLETRVCVPDIPLCSKDRLVSIDLKCGEPPSKADIFFLNTRGQPEWDRLTSNIEVRYGDSEAIDPEDRQRIFFVVNPKYISDALWEKFDDPAQYRADVKCVPPW